MEYIVFDKDLDGLVSCNLYSTYLAGKNHILMPVKSYEVADVVAIIPDGEKVTFLDVSVSDTRVVKLIKNKNLSVTLIDHHFHNKLQDVAEYSIVKQSGSTALILYSIIHGMGYDLDTTAKRMVAMATASDLGTCKSLPGRDAILCDIWDLLIPYLASKKVIRIARSFRRMINNPPLNDYAAILGMCLRSINRIYENGVVDNSTKTVFSTITGEPLLTGLVYRVFKDYNLVVVISSTKKYTFVKVLGRYAAEYASELYSIIGGTIGGRAVKVIHPPGNARLGDIVSAARQLYKKYKARIRRDIMSENRTIQVEVPKPIYDMFKEHPAPIPVLQSLALYGLNAVLANHYVAEKIICPKCGGIMSINKNGDGSGTIQYVCASCKYRYRAQLPWTDGAIEFKNSPAKVPIG